MLLKTFDADVRQAVNTVLVGSFKILRK